MQPTYAELFRQFKALTQQNQALTQKLQEALTDTVFRARARTRARARNYPVNGYHKTRNITLVINLILI